MTTEIDVVDDPYIDELTVSAPADIYAGTEVELTVAAKDQDGNALDLYKYVNASTAWVGGYTFTGGQNHTNRQWASITATSGALKVTKNSTKKTVTFKYKYTATGTETFPVTDIITVKSAKVSVTPVSAKVQKAGEIAGIQGLATGTKLAYGAGDPISIDLQKKLVFKDNYGGAVENDGTDTATTCPSFTVSTITAGKGSNVTANNTYYVYTVSKKNAGGTYAQLTTANDSTITATGDYRVTLYKYVGSAATYTNGATDTFVPGAANTYTITDLGNYDFTVSAASGLYKEGSFKASVAAGDELLWAGKDSAGNASTDTTKIKVTAYDTVLKADVEVPATQYTLTLSDQAATATANAIKMQTGRKEGDKTTPVTEKTLTAEVWYGGQSVASVDVKYSDADREAKSFSW